MCRGAAARKECLCALARLLRFLFAVHQRRELVSENILCFVQLSALPAIHLVNLRERQESQHAEAL